jgi:ankyrin repeat protein
MDQQSFIKIVKNWKWDEVTQALSKDSSLATRVYKNGMTPLHYCAETNLSKSSLPAIYSIDTAAALLSAGADVNSVRRIIDAGEEFHATPLWYAVAWGKNLDLACFLLESGSNPNNCMWAATWDENLEMAELLASHGAEIDPVFHHETPLLQIVRSRRLKLLGWLIAKGGNINFQDDKGYSALHYAVKKNHTLADIELLLKHGADPTLYARDGSTPIGMAQSQAKPKLVALLKATG